MRRAVTASPSGLALTLKTKRLLCMLEISSCPFGKSIFYNNTLHASQLKSKS